MRDVQLAQKFDLFQTLRNNSLQHATGRGTSTTLLGVVSSGGFRAGARGARPPLFLDQTEAQRAEKIFLGDQAPLFLGCVFWAPPPPPPAYLKVWIRGFIP